MRACVLRAPGPIDRNPLDYTDAAMPEPRADEILVRVRACGVCRTDLHIAEGELPPKKSPVIPGHQIVGTVEGMGASANRFRTGDRVGVAWLNRTDGVCEFCKAGNENLCIQPEFTGYTVNGGFAEYLCAPESFVYPLPAGFNDIDAAPLLCAGIIGFRCLRQSEVQSGQALGLYGFGAAAHVAIQVARHWGVRVFAFTRDARHRDLALELGAAWAGHAGEHPPEKLDAAIIFAPAGQLVPAALDASKRGGRIILGGIYMSPIPEMEYRLVYHERVIRSVANNTRKDGEDFLRVAAEIPIRTSIQTFPLSEANAALNALRRDAVRGAAVLEVA
jgi:alcohol dehydrogenase, propanol-preferring